MLDERWDVIVAGGSLAGASAGLCLAEKGRKVLILEKSVFPRSKVCGEFLSPAAMPFLERMNLLDEFETLGAAAISRARVFFPGGRGFSWRLPSVHRRSAAGISRRRLDAFLLERARRAGCRVEEGMEVRAVSREGEGYEIETAPFREPEKSVRLRCSVLVNAAGLLRRRRSAPRSPDGAVGFKAHFSGPFPEGEVQIYFFDGGYLGMAGIEEGRVNICGICRPEVLAQAGYEWDRLLQAAGERSPALGRWLQRAERKDEWLSCSHVRHGSEGDFANGFPAGDAAFFTEPFMGQGMTMAFATGCALAGLLEENRGLSRQNLETLYRSRLRRLYRSRAWSGNLFGWVMNRMDRRSLADRLVRRSPAVWSAATRLVCSGPRP